MESAAEAQQLAAVAAALELRDVASVARLTRAATITAVCEAGCTALAAFAANRSELTSEESEHAVKALLCAMQLQPMSVGVQQQGCRGLGFLCKTSAESRAVAGANGAIEAVSFVMRAHMENSDAIHAACCALASLTNSSKENCGRAHRAGALDALVSVMRAHPTCESVQTSGVLALAHMCVSFARFIDAAVLLGAPEILIDSLRSYPDSIALQHHALGALAALLPAELTVHKDDDGCWAQRAGGALSCVIHALRAHAADECVQSSACTAMYQLVSAQPINAAKALSLGAFPLLANVLGLHHLQHHVVLSCLAALELICEPSDDRVVAQFEDADVQAAICSTLAVLRAHPADLKVQGAACTVLKYLLGIHDTQHEGAAAEAGAMELMVHALREFSDTDLVLWNACTVLSTLAVCAPAQRHR